MLRTIGKSFGYAAKGCMCVCNAAKSVVRIDKTFQGLFSAKPDQGVFTGGLRRRFGLNQSEVKVTISSIENKVRDLYLKIGKVGSSIGDEKGLFENAEIKEVYGQIRIYEREIYALKKYLGELEKSETEHLPLKKISLKYKDDLEKRKMRSVRSAIEFSLKRAKFPLRSEAIIFEKALYDLLDEEMDIKRLAVSELGKMGNVCAGPVLKEMLKLEDPQLQAEVINSLIQLEDKDIFGVCKAFIKHEYPAIRTACVRGLYKSNRQDAIPLLISVLNDENAEVRNSSAMLLGWLEAKSAVIPLLQAAKDPDKRVRKSAILSLTNLRDDSCILSLIRLLDDEDVEIREKIVGAIERIAGENIKFDVHDDANRSGNIEKLKEWWMIRKSELIAGTSLQPEKSKSPESPESPDLSESPEPVNIRAKEKGSKGKLKDKKEQI